MKNGNLGQNVKLKTLIGIHPMILTFATGKVLSAKPHHDSDRKYSQTLYALIL